MPGYLGIDWGTHSSKWVFQADTGHPIIGTIWDSSVCRIDDSLHMNTLARGFRDPTRETALKRKLIQDPDQSFWEGARPKLEATLGEAVVFSLLTLLLDAKNTLLSSSKALTQGRSLTIRLSHPNWVSEDNIRALQCFRDAAVVAMSIFLEGIEGKIGPQTISIATKDLRSAVLRHRPILCELPEFSGRYIHHEYVSCSQGSISGTRWQLIFESCAAGFPYLVEGERETFSEELRTFPFLDRIRKILVVDIGAGSTDAGYMVRTVRPRNPRGIMKPLLIWVPAADALEVAGMWLTNKILADFRQQGHRITPVEAEEFKIGSQSWYDKPYAREWTTLIGDHVGEYVRSVRDEVCLRNKPKLELVLTGGSSVVPPLKAEALRQVRLALQNRGLSQGFSEETRIIEVVRPVSVGRSYREIEFAQLAVSLGASDPLLCELKAYPDGLVDLLSS